MRCIIYSERVKNMKHETKSNNTKKALSASLKKFMKQKKLSKISVSEIVSDCGMNRKTFYYHFEDIYALLKWTLEQETVEVIKNFDFILNPEEALIFVADYVDNNSHILNCAYDSIGRDGMNRFFYDDFYNVILSIVEKLEKSQNVALPENFKKCMVAFYTEALAGILLSYFQHKSIRRDEMIKYILFILKTTIPSLINSYDQIPK